MRGAEHDVWTAGTSYEAYMGRWSRRVADAFLAWFDPPRGGDWLEVGCGTGALTAAALARAPGTLLAVDPSPDFLGHARAALPDPRVDFRRGEATALPAADASLDVAVSGLVLNFVADRPAAFAEMRRVLRPGGRIGLYVWDYPGGGMEMLARFWSAAAEVDARAGGLDEACRFDFCTREGLLALATSAGLSDIAVGPVTIETPFADFAELWRPFTLGTGPAPGYLASLDAEARRRLEARVAERLGPGPIRLSARAWAVRGNV